MKRLDKPPFLWSSLRTIGNSYPSKLFVLAPFVAYIIIFHSEVVRFLGSNYIQDNVPAQAGPPASLYMWYFGIMLFGVASIIYTLFCPAVIKNHIDADAYCEYGQGFLVPQDVIRLCNFIIESSRVDENIRNHAIAQKTILGSRVVHNLHGADTILVRKTFYALTDASSGGLRMIAFIGFAAGFLLMFMPSALSLAKVIMTLLK